MFRAVRIPYPNYTISSDSAGERKHPVPTVPVTAQPGRREDPYRCDSPYAPHAGAAPVVRGNSIRPIFPVLSTLLHRF